MDNQTVLNYRDLVIKNLTAGDVTAPRHLPDNSTQSAEGIDFLEKPMPLKLLFVTLFVVGIVGNTLVIYLTLAYKRMRTAIPIMLLNMAVVDVLYLLGNALYTVTIQMLRQTSHDLYPYCKIFSIFSACRHGITIYTLVTISVCRYVIIVYPHRARLLVTLTTVAMLIAVIWVISVTSFTAVILYIPCMRTFSMARDVQIFMYHYLAFGYVIPLLVINVLSVVTLRVLRRPSLVENRKMDDNKRRASLSMFIVSAGFAICFLPYFVTVLAPTYHHLSSANYFRLQMMSEVFSFANSCINPIIYTIVCKEFRKNLRETFCRGFREKPNPASQPVLLNKQSSMSSAATNSTAAGGVEKSSERLL